MVPSIYRFIDASHRAPHEYVKSSPRRAIFKGDGDPDRIEGMHWWGNVRRRVEQDWIIVSGKDKVWLKHDKEKEDSSQGKEARRIQ